jgi:hypothetical protein
MLKPHAWLDTAWLAMYYFAPHGIYSKRISGFVKTGESDLMQAPF